MTVDSLVAELSLERRALARSERALIEGRVTNETAWLLALRIRRQRVRELELRLLTDTDEAA